MEGSATGTEPRDRLTHRLASTAAKGGATALLGSAIGRGIEALFQLVLARFLGMTQYGLFALGHTVYTLLTQFLLLGAENGVIRFGAAFRTAHDGSRLKGLVRVSLLLVGTSAVCGTVVVFAVAHPIAAALFSEPELAGFLRVIVLAVPLFALFRVSAALLRSQQRIRYSVALRQVIYPVSKFATVGIALAIGCDLLGVGYAFVVGVGMAFMVSVLAVRTLILLPVRRELARLPTGLLRFSIGTFLIGAAHIVLSRTDRLMLGALRSVDQVGIYNAAFVLASQAAVFLSSFNVIFAPMVADLHEGGAADELGSLFKSVTKWIVALTLPVFLALVIFGDSILRLFGTEFAAGWPILAALAVAQLVNAGVGGVGYLLIMTGHQWLEFGNSLALMCLNVGLNYWLIGRYGALGAGIATGASLVAINIVRVVQVRRLLGFHPYRKGFFKLVPAVGAAAAAAVLIRVIAGTSVAGFLGGLAALVVVYGGLALAFGLEDVDRVVLEVIRSRLGQRRGGIE